MEVKQYIDDSGNIASSQTDPMSFDYSIDDPTGYFELISAQQDLNNAWSAAQAQKAMDYQERMSNTAHQREVEDLKAAGLNPVLSAGGAGATTGTGHAASAGDSNITALYGLISKAMDAQFEQAAALNNNAKAVDNAVSTSNSFSGSSASSIAGFTDLTTEEEAADQIRKVLDDLSSTLKKDESYTSNLKKKLDQWFETGFGTSFGQWFQRKTGVKPAALAAAIKQGIELYGVYVDSVSNSKFGKFLWNTDGTGIMNNTFWINKADDVKEQVAKLLNKKRDLPTGGRTISGYRGNGNDRSTAYTQRSNTSARAFAR